MSAKHAVKGKTCGAFRLCGAPDIEDFEIERQVLAGKRMIGIQYHSVIRQSLAR